MKYLLLCFAVFSIGVDADLLTLTIEEDQGICKNKTEIDQTLIDQAQNGEFSADEKVKEYYFCYGQKIGFIAFKQVTVDGRQKANVRIIDKEALTNWLVNDLQYDLKTVEDAFTSCGLDKPDPDVFESIKCLSKNKLPVDVVSPNYVDRSVEDLTKREDSCKSQSNVDQNLISKVQNGDVIDVADSESIGSYYICYLLYGGVLDLSGNISYSYLKNWFKLMLKQNSDKVDSALDKCYKSRVNEEKDALQIAKCFADEKLPLDVVANQ